MLTREMKTQILNEAVEILNGSELLLFTDFTMMSVAESDEMRKAIFNQFKEEAGYKVLRNTLLRQAIKQAGLNEAEYAQFTDGNVGIFYVKNGDGIEALKLLVEFAKKHKDKPVIKGGVLEGKVFNAEEAQIYAKLPSKPQLIAMLLGSLNAPISGLVNVTSGMLKKVLYALNAVKEQKENQ